MKILKKGTYYGTEKSIWDQAVVILSEYDYLSPQTDWHYHENPYFMYILRGNLMDINKKSGRGCRPGGDHPGGR